MISRMTVAKNIRRASALFIACLACLCSGQSHAAPSAAIPPIATLAGFTASRDTIEAMKAQFGAGIFAPGRQPVGARVWELRGLGVYVAADGLSGSSHGRTVDILGLERDNRWPVRHSPAARASLKKLAFLGTILPGMSRKDVMARLKGKLPPPVVVSYHGWEGSGHQVLGWHMTGQAGHGAPGKPRFTHWDTNLLFDRDTLAGIEVSCG